MTFYLLDTNVISETSRSKPHPHVTRWLAQLPRLILPAVTVYEVAAGIERLSAGPKRIFLEAWFAELLGPDSEVLPFDREAALSCAALEAQARRQRQTIEIRDLLILSIAKSRGAAVATRNVAHFQGFGVPVYDPFSHTHFH